jgi:hypothetical protein
MIVLVGLVAALDIVVWRLRPCHPTQDEQQTSQRNGAPQIPTCGAEIDRPDKQDKLGQALNKLETDPIVWLTVALVGLGWLQFRMYSEQLAATKIIERAYVDLSHQPPGLVFVGEENGLKHEVRVTIGIKNNGNTPSDVLAFKVTFVHGGDLLRNPERPPIPTTTDAIFTVMPRDTIYTWHNFPISSFIELQQIGDAIIPAYVIGWVVYRDRFEKRHRSGYARRLIRPSMFGTNNLVFVDVPGYNYEEDLDED